MLAGRRFYKVSGSGNDFVVLDAIAEPLASLPAESLVRRVCERHMGVGADGLVVLSPSEGTAARMIYYNRDGSRGEMCGNAGLCVASLVSELGYAEGERFQLDTDSGTLQAAIVDGLPEVQLPAAHDVAPSAPDNLAPGEMAIGSARVGVPHLIVLCADGREPDVHARGSALRNNPDRAEGTNVNFLMRGMSDDVWAIRTFERGVEGETLACGTGAGAAAVLLRAWRATDANAVSFTTRSGKTLSVSFDSNGSDGTISLRGEGRVVYEGRLRSVP